MVGCGCGGAHGTGRHIALSALLRTLCVLCSRCACCAQVIDEIQMMGDEQRGWAWTRALMGVPANEVHM